MLTLQQERARRRTFAIISHPDAGKTTLTEKLLLHSGAIHIAGSVKARKGRRHAISDWMDIEKQRGISVASSVMQMEYRGHVLNLLDTPGHQDFSEDTYRVLTAVDAALMIIDAANGVEAQTLRLIEVCRSRQTPIITFVNKMDREVRYPLELVDELEQVLGIPIVPFSWPIGMGRNFHGVIDAARATVKTFSPGWHDKLISPEAVYDFHEVTNMSSDDAIRDARTELELVLASAPAFSEAAFHDGRQSPLFFGSAVNNFGVQEVLDALVDIAPSPKSRPALERTVEAIESEFTGVVFKIQANMDPLHRDRIAFIRVCSGRFSRDSKYLVTRTGKMIRAGAPVSFLSQRREAIEQAYPGDIVGLPNHGALQLGDTLTSGEPLHFLGLPFFAPEIFKRVDIDDPMKVKQLKSALLQLGQEGAIQVFRDASGASVLLGAFGELQFDVALERLRQEYGVPARLHETSFRTARWISAANPDELSKFVSHHSGRIYQDAVQAPAYLFKTRSELDVISEQWPMIRFHQMRESIGRLALTQI